MFFSFSKRAKTPLRYKGFNKFSWDKTSELLTSRREGIKEEYGMGWDSGKEDVEGWLIGSNII